MRFQDLKDGAQFVVTEDLAFVIPGVPTQVYQKVYGRSLGHNTGYVGINEDKHGKHLHQFHYDTEVIEVGENDQDS